MFSIFFLWANESFDGRNKHKLVGPNFIILLHVFGVRSDLVSGPGPGRFQNYFGKRNTNETGFVFISMSNSSPKLFLMQICEIYLFIIMVTFFISVIKPNAENILHPFCCEKQIMEKKSANKSENLLSQYCKKIKLCGSEGMGYRNKTGQNRDND